MVSGSPAQPDHDQLAREFTDEMHEGYRYLARTIGYRAKAFLEMLAMHGGVGAARLLLQGRDASDGFTRLWAANMLDHSVEAAVLKAKYRLLFTGQEREVVVVAWSCTALMSTPSCAGSTDDELPAALKYIG